jgi:hypothetical protein
MCGDDIMLHLSIVARTGWFPTAIFMVGLSRVAA